MVELGLPPIPASSVAEVVLSYEWRDNSSVVGGSFTAGTATIIRDSLIQGSSKCPNMFSWSLSVCEAYSINIIVIYCATTINIIWCKCIRAAKLVSYDFPTQSGVLDSIERECGGHTSTVFSSTCPLW